MLRAYTANVPSRARLLLKYLLFPGTNWVSRDKSAAVKMFRTGTAEKPVRTLDCGCGNAFFTHQAALRNAKCLGITIHEWEKQNCEEMRDFLGYSDEQMEFRVARLDELAADPEQRRQYDQVLLFDVIEHIMDAPATFRQIHDLLDEDGFVYISTPDRDWQRNASRIRVTPVEDGWHVRNGYTFDQLEAVLEQNGFEPIDRLRFGTLGSSLVIWIQHTLFRSKIDPLTVVFYPFLKALSILLSPFRDTHTIFVLARKKRVPAALAPRLTHTRPKLLSLPD
ncbi:class I SAM-dependent methyltransferase [Singulisphaera sp. PoT]|uniref:class I SAM-dependent methyltransferase n=1 Tax=Singulisphaera sp. PoT TaxID=3411797 RepID=UPI003BF4D969